MADTPTTEAGRRLFTDIEPMDMWESNGVTPEDILAIEAEAVAAERARIRRVVVARVADWLGTGPWQNFDGFDTHGDPYRRVLAILDPEPIADLGDHHVGVGK